MPPDVVDGFLLTGDQGRLDSDGNLVITGRLKLVVDIGGLKVNLVEVEAALRDHAGVRECAVVPVAVSQTVSRLKAFVVPMSAHAPPPDGQSAAPPSQLNNAHRVEH
jgi:acyl-coenzyme A synthetase/AMP-(fatty) acid ligase